MGRTGITSLRPGYRNCASRLRRIVTPRAWHRYCCFEGMEEAIWTMFNTLNWDDLRVFLHAARAGNLSQTAKRLRLDQSTVSRRIAQIEASLGMAVFERHCPGLSSTRPANGCCAMPSGSKARSSPCARRPVPAIPGSWPESAACHHGGHRLALSRATLLSPAQQCAAAHRRARDVGADRLGPQARGRSVLSLFSAPGPGLISERIGKFRLGLYASRSYLDCHGMPDSLRELQDHWFVSYIEDLIQVNSVRWLADIIEQPRIAFHSNSMIAQMNATAGGLGIVLLPSFATAGRPDLIPVLPGIATTTREVWLNVHSDLQFAPRIRAVRSFLRTR